MKYSAWVAGLAWLIGITWLHHIPRTEFYHAWGVYSLSFAAYAWLVFNKHPFALQYGLGLALLGRLASFFFDPLLSDDYFRFIWDGMLSNHGIHPMAFTPNEVMQQQGIFKVDSFLYSMLNSKDYYSVYPPFTQFIFTVSYWINGLNIQGHIYFYKTVALVLDGTIIFLLYKLLQVRNVQVSRVLVYALNPLILIEYSGNLHLDGLLIAGLLGAVWLAEKDKIFWAGSVMSLSILSKIVSLILLPFMPLQLYWKKIIYFTILALGWTTIIFWTFFGRHTGWLESVWLWFNTFEFNASLYYILSWIGYEIKGYNFIHFIGPGMTVVTCISLAILWWKYIRIRKMDWPIAMLFAITIFLLMSTTIHPWYLGLLLVLGILSGHNYPVIWTYLVFLSYSHYQDGYLRENYALITVEYGLLFTFALLEWKRKRKSLLAY